MYIVCDSRKYRAYFRDGCYWSYETIVDFMDRRFHLVCIPEEWCKSGDGGMYYWEDLNAQKSGMIEI